MVAQRTCLVIYYPSVVRNDRYFVLFTYSTTCSHVENIWDPWSESQHNDGKGCKKQKNIFHHNIDAEYDGAKVFCSDANLYYKFDNYQSNNGEKISLIKWSMN